MTGRTISHYKILSKLGSGAMGDVYKAEDLDLKRTVALKFLSHDALDEQEIKARLIREAQAAALLDHPNICHVYGIHEEEGETFLAMAYIEGPSLADKIQARPLPLEESLDLATQIAAGLEEAHEKGITHRDIKPQNILLTSKGQVKILDFGLAAVAGRSRLTKSGTTLGTPLYMAPEQLLARDVDRRADIWALGCVLYELLTQHTPFEADYEQAIAYGILNEDPEPVSAQRSDVQPELDRILSKALAKEPAERYQHADDMAADLRILSAKLRSGHSPVLKSNQAPAADPPAQAQPSQPSKLQVALGVAVVVLLAALLWSWGRSPSGLSEMPVGRTTIPLPDEMDNPQVAVSPDGRYVAIANFYSSASSGSRLWLRSLDEFDSRALDGTEGASNPFWSPDSRWLGFEQNNQLKKIAPDGGAPVLIASAEAIFGAPSWSADGGKIFFSMRGGIAYRVPAAGGEPQRVFDESSDSSSGGCYDLAVIADASKDSILCSDGRSSASPTIYIRDLATGESRRITAGWGPRLEHGTGQLFYHLGPRLRSDLWSRPFSPKTLEFSGEARRIASGASMTAAPSPNVLAYVSMPPSVTRRLVWRDRAGRAVGTAGQPQSSMLFPELSPNERSVALQAEENQDVDIWIHEAGREAKFRLTTGEENEIRPLWSGDGLQLVFSVDPTGTIFRIRSDGAGKPRAIFKSEGRAQISDASPDLNTLVVQIPGERGVWDLWLLKRNGDQYEASPIVESEFIEPAGKLSPDARFIAYCSDRSGDFEVYVQPLDGDGRRVQVSFEGGTQPRWSADGKNLFYVARQDTLVAVKVSTDPTFQMGEATELFSNNNLFQIGSFSYPSYDVSNDGQRFLLLEPADQASRPEIRVIQNWQKAFGL